MSDARAQLSIAPRVVDAAAIERGLAELWESAHQGLAVGAAVTQACMSNLLIWCAPGSAASGIAQEVPAIVERHPARVVLLVPEATDLAADIEAYVSAQCHLSAGDRQVCSEYVTVSARHGATRRLPSVARPLVIGDLPTSLWWAGSAPPPRGGALFRELAEMADQLIFDSREWTDPAPGLVVTAEWIESRDGAPHAADLAWRRLTPWRQLISQVLDPAVLPGALDSIRSLAVQHGPHGLPQALFAVGWLASCLGWQSVERSMQPGVQVAWDFRSARGPVHVAIRRMSTGAADVQRLEIARRAANVERRAAFVRTAECLVATLDDRSEPFGALAAPPQPRAALIAKQLPERYGDRLFDRALRFGGAMAQRLAHPAQPG
jgi:glucose-6-phosphate dehydrogenase assembly protein OpcA